MDLMKVFDQTVRDIKREVNLKVLKVPEIEQKVLDATDDEPWGPHGTALAEIAQATKKFSECQMVMNVIWTRITETGKNWRFVYKALAVIEYLVAHGSERAVDDIIEHTFQISALASFEYVEPSGKDQGINVRKKAETIVNLLNNKDKIQEVRNKASANREKYFGLSSSGVTYKSGAASFSSSNFRSNDRYGGFGSTGDSETFKDSYRDKDHYGDDKFEKTTRTKKETSRYGSNKQDSHVTEASETSKKSSKSDKYDSVPSQNAPSGNDDDDDFDPRGTANSNNSAGSNQVDLFGQQNLVDLLDIPASVPTNNSTNLDNDSSEDLFANADFVSATPQPNAGTSTVPQTNVDLFASQPAPSISSTIDFFAAPGPVPQPDNKASKSEATSSAFDPFAAVPLNNFDGTDPFGPVSSQSNPSLTEASRNSSDGGNPGNINGSSVENKPTVKKDGFQVKSGIWADSLSRGLIDLNISAPKKVNLADVGIVGGLGDGFDEKDKGPMPTYSMGRAMGMGQGIGKPGFGSAATDDDFFSSLSNQQHQFGNFQKGT
ncbi:clathrin interactor EPSIN 1 isoform X1 [Andrographis paniculata]|uniref:clathrin interactor EPSIN 1 isoform X1 n=2 Tax=Andrographis paniculata TaxID=175694 RepID=UPI0021E8C436|nr:clathrin interactor EPSIN 1 isoform X1 [Andrographis paniculata]